MSAAPDEDRGAGGRRLFLLARLLVPLCAVLLYADALRLPLLGHDSLPQIAASRVAAPGDLLDLVARPLMDDRFRADFWRPVQALSLALDHALFGLDAAGYQAVDLVLFAACALAVLLLGVRLLGRRALLPAVLGALLFVIHPSQWEVIPVVARRNDVLACLFSVLALFALVEPRRLARPRPPWLSGVLALLAMGSKETGFALAPLALIAVYVCSKRSGPLARARHALTHSAPVLAATAVLLLGRLVVLGGLGGYVDTGRGVLDHTADLVSTVLLPQLPIPVLETVTPWPTLLLTALAACLLVLGMFLSREAGAHGAAGAPVGGPGAGPVAVLGAAWLAGSALLSSYSGQSHPWYALYPLAGLALLFAALVHLLVTLLPRARGALRVLCAVTLLLLGLLLARDVAYSKLFVDYPQWEQAGQRMDAFLGDLEPRIEAAAPGSVIVSTPMPDWIRTREPGPRLRGAAVLQEYTVEAWGELRFPDRALRFVREDGERLPAPGEVVVVVRRRGTAAGPEPGPGSE